MLELDTPDSPSMTAFRVMAQLRQQKGLHQESIKVLDKALALRQEDSVSQGGGEG